MKNAYQIRTIIQESELIQFQTCYQQLIREKSNSQLNIKVSLDYLQQANVKGCFDKNNHLVGGYVLNSEAEFRILEAITAKERENLLFMQQHALDKFGELTCIWHNKGISANTFALRVWPRIIWHSIAMKKPYILGIGFQNKMHNVYTLAKPKIVYQGRSKDQQFNNYVYIYAYTPRTLLLTFASNFLKKMFLSPLKRLFKIRKGLLNDNK